MTKKIKVLLEDYEPLTEIGKKAKEQLIELLSRKNPNTFSKYDRVCVYTNDQIIEMYQQSKEKSKQVYGCSKWFKGEQQTVLFAKS